MRAAAHAGAGGVPTGAGEASTAAGDAIRAVTLGLAVVAFLLFIGYPLCWLVFGAVGLPGDFSPHFLVRAFTRPEKDRKSVV